MKLIALFALILISFSACQLFTDGKESYKNVKTEIKEVSEKISGTKKKITETVENIDTAIEKAKETGAAMNDVLN
ncbi:hypothetical protein GF354_03985 [Candidatus Peregrinibacteria bacterium]|nr:hypothetical protein [Candidatus Peregrinibacteria bacterium]